MNDTKSKRGHVQFWLAPELREALEARAAGSRAPQLDEVARRDLWRYYCQLRFTLERVALTEGEALLIVDVRNGLALTPEVSARQQLWADVADAVELDGLDAKWSVNGAALVAKLRALTDAEALAIVDAAERAWRLLAVGGGDARPVLRQVGLVRDP